VPAEQWELVSTKHRAPLSDKQWQAVRSRYLQRRKAQTQLEPDCAICQDNIGLRRQALLSCSHSFHATCLSSIERYLGLQRCPLCRTEDYQLYYINDGWHCARSAAATRLQAWWRAVRVSKIYSTVLQERYRRNPVLAGQYALDGLEGLREQVVQQNEELQHEVDSFLASLEQGQAQRATTMAHLESQLQATAVQRVDWPRVRQQAEGRREDGCPICLQPLAEAAVLLRCTHTFHHTCLSILIKFTQRHESLQCPVCRDVVVQCPKPF
jgi:hypothetical protein